MNNDDLTLMQIMLKAGLILTLSVLSIWCLIRIVKWAKGMPKAAYLVMAIFPLLSLFPIPPPVFKNVAKAKQEQRKKKEVPGDPLE
ncbi:hypothetical protein PRUB_a2018 [Pseudoalteromonas rubra]|uniref:Uncharacterized protein n=2 Tax=Pseudoalteromonas rubra TaxID=43658 RepID=A0A8T0CDX1_9GAMM|nr:hypothetical protein [Pseudoalteromonas rubra]KAF7788916.1 hypothetical protein PRUB_a2018 [Pseudoalteromonas rubra]